MVSWKLRDTIRLVIVGVIAGMLIPASLFVIQHVARAETRNCAQAPAGGIDLTIPNGTLVQAGGEVEKGWRLENCGDSTWDGVTAKLVSSDWEFVPKTLDVPRTRPGQTAEIWMRLEAPTEPGCYRFTYQLFSRQGRYFPTKGAVFFTEIRVTQDGAPPPTISEADLADALVPAAEVGPNWSLDENRLSETSGEGCERTSWYAVRYRNATDFAQAQGGRKIAVSLEAYGNASAAEAATFTFGPFLPVPPGKPERLLGIGDGSAYRRTPGMGGPNVPIVLYSFRVSTVVVAVGVWDGDEKCYSSDCARGIETTPAQLDVQAREFIQRQIAHLRAVLAGKGVTANP